ncbi:MAG: MerR family transcriptional regulator [Endomicrobiia bacterium]|nr:MerR family transcriptional regulator [Endomicrobiaceae bacterium]MDD5101854.1 MerR family transcriptional regulator [Endomicrobiaceae bacterium]
MLNIEKKYLTIGEISKITQIPTYTLRYWEREFKLLKPERHSGLRKYSSSDVELINKIKELLYKQKFTIAGVKKYLNGDKRKKVNSQEESSEVCNSEKLSEVKEELLSLLEFLKK